MKIQSCLQYFNDSVLLEQDDRLLWYYIIKMQDFWEEIISLFLTDE